MNRTLAILTLIFTTLSLNAKEIDYSTIAAGTFRPLTISALRSMADGEHYTTMSQGRIVKFRYSDGAAVDTLFSAWDCTPKVKINGYAMSADEQVLLLPTDRESIYRHSSRANYYIYDRPTATLAPVSMNGKQQEATLSPDGKMVAFVRNNNLVVADLKSKTEKQITFDGRQGETINGIPDWVYEEEYGFSRAFEWSPSSDAIAYYRFDERHVKEYNMTVFDTMLYPQNATFKYPKAGERNSEVQIKVYRIASAATTTIDLGKETDIYIPRIEWTERANLMAVHRLNRLQNSYDLLIADAILGGSRVIYSERNPKYIERIDDQKITFLADAKRFIVKNENDGFMHLYLYDLRGKLLKQLTKGEWEVVDICGVDEKNGRVYYTSTEKSPLQTQLYSCTLTGAGKRLLTDNNGVNTVTMSKNCKYYICHHSSSTTPTVATLHSANGKKIRTLENNIELQKRLTEYQMPHKEFFTFTTPNGDQLNGYILKPADFDSTRSYPLFMTQYSGPGSQSVSNSWGASWEWALLKEGYLVACVDGRGTGRRGEAFRKSTYENLGGPETQDQIFAAKYLGSLPYIDAARIGIYGWSYGGFMALNCILKGADVFKMAVAVAPVTSWRFYDTIYTELYNGLPQSNPEGYDDNSPLNFADSLRGKLLIAHGSADDNVHIQNSYQMIERLLDAKKDFEWIIYPDKNHGMNDRRDHLMERIIRFTKTNL